MMIKNDGIIGNMVKLTWFSRQSWTTISKRKPIPNIFLGNKSEQRWRVGNNHTSAKNNGTGFSDDVQMVALE